MTVSPRVWSPFYGHFYLIFRAVLKRALHSTHSWIVIQLFIWHFHPPPPPLYHKQLLKRETVFLYLYEQFPMRMCTLQFPDSSVRLVVNASLNEIQYLHVCLLVFIAHILSPDWFSFFLSCFYCFHFFLFSLSLQFSVCVSPIPSPST